jgi:hypothetical protein
MQLNTPMSTFPRTMLQVRMLKSPLPKGLTLLGFKPQSALAPHHQFREPTFIYPGEARR